MSNIIFVKRNYPYARDIGNNLGFIFVIDDSQ